MRKKEKQLSSQYDKYFGRVIIFRKDIIFERENILKSDSIFLFRRDQFLCISVFTWRNPVRVASPHGINLEEPGQGCPAQPGLIRSSVSQSAFVHLYICGDVKSIVHTIPT